MATGYTKEFLVNASVSKWKYYGVDDTAIRKLSNDYYDQVGKDKFRTSCALDAAAIKEFKATGFCNL